MYIWGFWVNGWVSEWERTGAKCVFIQFGIRYLSALTAPFTITIAQLNVNLMRPICFKLKNPIKIRPNLCALVASFKRRRFLHIPRIVSPGVTVLRCAPHTVLPPLFGLLRILYCHNGESETARTHIKVIQCANNVIYDAFDFPIFTFSHWTTQ